mgnify:CR=1 FL=1
MEIIPAINCPDFECVKSKLAIISRELPFVSWLQFDVADGKFAPIITWNNPQEFLNFKSQNPNLKNINIELHLMVEKPEDFIEEWLKVGVRRVIVHLETLSVGVVSEKDLIKENSRLAKILEKCSEYDVELMLAVNPETPIEEIFPYLDSFLFVQILAVKPGFSGQEFNKEVVEKIKILRERIPDIVIEVDGGINQDTAEIVKEAGADIIVSASYIFNNKDSAYKAYCKLKEVIDKPL